MLTNQDNENVEVKGEDYQLKLPGKREIYIYMSKVTTVVPFHYSFIISEMSRFISSMLASLFLVFDVSVVSIERIL